jgi:hypothetical protein
MAVLHISVYLFIAAESSAESKNEKIKKTLFFNTFGVFLFFFHRALSINDYRTPADKCPSNLIQIAESLRKECGIFAESLRNLCGITAESLRKKCGKNARSFYKR